MQGRLAFIYRTGFSLCLLAPFQICLANSAKSTANAIKKQCTACVRVDKKIGTVEKSIGDLEIKMAAGGKAISSRFVARRNSLQKSMGRLQAQSTRLGCAAVQCASSARRTSARIAQVGAALPVDPGTTNASEAMIEVDYRTCKGGAENGTISAIRMDGSLSTISQAPALCRAKSLLMHPSKRFAYVNGGYKLQVFEILPGTYEFVSKQIVDLGNNSASAVIMHPSGQRLLVQSACDRNLCGGEHSKTLAFNIAEDGTLIDQHEIRNLGWERGIALSADGSYLIVGGADYDRSGNKGVFKSYAVDADFNLTEVSSITHEYIPYSIISHPTSALFIASETGVLTPISISAEGQLSFGQSVEKESNSDAIYLSESGATLGVDSTKNFFTLYSVAGDGSLSKLTKQVIDTLSSRGRIKSLLFDEARSTLYVGTVEKPTFKVLLYQLDATTSQISSVAERVVNFANAGQTESVAGMCLG